MKKILILGNHAEGLYNFRKELIIQLIEGKFEVHYSVPNHEKVKLLKEIGGIHHAITINRRGKNPLEDIELIKYYYSLIKKIDPDIILTYTIKPNVYGGIAASFLRKPVIANITGRGSALHRDDIASRIVKSLYKLGLRKTNHIFFQNQGDQEYFLRNKIVSIEKASLIPGSGVNTNEFSPKEKTECANKIIRFLFIGRILKDKGIQEFLNAAQYVKAKYDNVSFSIIGAYDAKEYKPVIDELVEKGIVEYLGVLLDVKEEIVKSDCIVLPSYHEGMSNVLLEGASMEKPLIATNINGCREIIDNEVNGFLCEPKDAESLIRSIIRFIELSDEKRMQMGLNSRKKILKDFVRQLIIKRYMNIISEILK